MYEIGERRECELLAQIENLRATSERALLHAKAFADLGQTLNSTHSTPAAARVIVDVVDRLLGWDACTLSLYCAESDTTEPLLIIDTIEGRRIDVTHARVTRRTASRAKKVLQDGAQLILREEQGLGARSRPFGDTIKASASIIVARIRHGAKAVGVLSIESYKKRSYNQEALNTLQALADYCGGALDRIRVEAGLRESETRLRKQAENISAQRITNSKLVGVRQDTTERKRWEEGPGESEGRFVTFMNNVPGFAWMKDPQGRYVFLSPATARLAFVPKDWQGKTDDELWTREIAAEYKANDQKVIATGKTLQTIELFPGKGGKPGYVLVNKFPIFDRTGAIVLIGGISVDITARKLAEEQLQASREQLRALAARLQGARDEESSRIAREIHDVLGQDLTSLNIDLIWLLDKVKEETNRPLSRQLRKRLKSMESLLKGMVKSVQRLASDLRPGMLDDFGLTSTLEWQAEDFTRRTGIRSRWRRKPDVVKLGREDATALFRIFQEALTNIARHSGARDIQLALEQDGDCVVLQVKDDGRGFNESKLLSPDSLGLLGMRERALLIGAGLEIRSCPREGTMVTVVLPGAAAESNGQQMRTTRRDHTNRR